MAKKKASIDAASKTRIDDLVAKLRIAIPKSVESLSQEFSDICGFAICTTWYVEFLAPVFQRKCELNEDDPYGFDRFSPPEWAVMNEKSRNDTFGKDVDQARLEFCSHCETLDEDTSSNVRTAFMDALLDLLVCLDTDNEIGTKTDERYLALWIDDDDDFLLKASKQLNTKKMYKRVRDVMSIGFD